MPKIKITAECLLTAEEYMRGFRPEDMPELLHILTKHEGEHAFNFLADAAGRDHATTSFRVSASPVTNSTLTPAQIVVATLRDAASWGADSELAELMRQAASEIESCQDLSATDICPFCEEAICDNGCPLESERKINR